MKKSRFAGALLAGIMALSGAPYISQPLMTVACAESAALPAPEGLKAETVSYDYAKLSWNAVKGAYGYRIFKYSSKTKNYDAVADTTEPSIYIRDLSPKTKYKFRVAALAISGNKDIAVQTMSDPTEITTPGMPAPASISVSVDTDSVTLRWTGGYKDAAYRVYKYSSKSGKYVKYKDVTGQQCKIEGLKSGTTYKFRIATLAKTGDKYIVQEKSPVITAVPAKGEAFTLPDLPKYGVNSSEALKFMGASYYTITAYESQGVTYTLGSDSVYGIGITNSTALMFNDKDEYYGAMVIKQTTTNEKEILAGFRKRNGEPKVYKDDTLDMYVWKKGSELMLAMIYSGMAAYIEIDLRYTPDEMIKSLEEYLKMFETGSGDV